MQPKRIAVLSVHTSPLAPLGGNKTGGMNVYVREMARELGERGIQVDVFTRSVMSGQSDDNLSLGDNVRVIYVKAGPAQPLAPDDIYPYLSEFAAGVIAYAMRHNVVYDVVYSHYWLSGWVANKLKEVWNVPVLHMFHTLGQMKQRIGTGNTSLPDVRIATETQVVNWADRVIAATPAEHSQLLWLYRADRRKIAIIPPGVNTDVFHPRERDEAKAQLGIQPDSDLLLFVGRIEPLKAVDSVLEALALMKQDHARTLDNLCFAVVGGDPDNPGDVELSRLKHLTDRLELDDVVDFVGAKDHELLPLYYAAAKVVVMPSDYESFGMVALEAMASGTPVIASEVGGLAFLVRDAVTGYLVPARDASALRDRIVWTLEHPDNHAQLSTNASSVAQQYAWPNIVDQLLDEFESVIRQSVNPRKR